MRGVLRRLLISSALSAIVLLAPPIVRAQTAYQFELPAQSLADSLRAVGRQTGTNILFEPHIIKDVQAPALHAQLTISEAISRLLAGTPLSIRRASAETLIVERATRDASKIPEKDTVTPSTSAVLEVSGYTRLAQAETSPSILTRPESDRTQQRGAERIVALEEIVVTGSHIRGERSAGSAIQFIGRSDIDASGYGTVQDVLNTIPQNIGGAPSEDFSGNHTGNYNRGAGINLRGLGADATLVLVNGRRQPSSGTDASFVDVSSIPTSAVERIELLTDGASAIYGSDAVGGVVNIVLREDYDGAETRVRAGSAGGDARELQFSQVLGKAWDGGGNILVGYQFYDRAALAISERKRTATEDRRSFGGADFRTETSNPGNIVDPETFEAVYAIPQGQDGTALTAEDLAFGTANLQDLLEGADLLPQQRMHSAFFAGNYRLTERLKSTLTRAIAAESRISGCSGIPCTWKCQVAIRSS